MRGRQVSFTRDAINNYLGNPNTLAKGEQYAYYKRVAQKDWNLEHVSDDLVYPGRSFMLNSLGRPMNLKIRDRNAPYQDRPFHFMREGTPGDKINYDDDDSGETT
ncbi:hypothetical protein RYX36_020423 [Vicia faba]